MSSRSLSVSPLPDAAQPLAAAGRDSASPSPMFGGRAVRVIEFRQVAQYTSLIDPRKNVRITKSVQGDEDVGGAQAIKNLWRIAATVHGAVPRFFAYIGAVFATLLFPIGLQMGKMSELEIRQRELVHELTKIRFKDDDCHKEKYTQALQAYAQEAWEQLIKIKGSDFLKTASMESFMSGALQALDEELAARGVHPAERMKLAIDLHEQFSLIYKEKMREKLQAEVSVHGLRSFDEAQEIANVMLEQELRMACALMSYLKDQDLTLMGRAKPPRSALEDDRASSPHRAVAGIADMRKKGGTGSAVGDRQRLLGLDDDIATWAEENMSPEAIRRDVHAFFGSLEFEEDEAKKEELARVIEEIPELGDGPEAGSAEVVEAVAVAHAEYDRDNSAALEARKGVVRDRMQAVEALAEPIRTLIGQIGGRPENLAGKELEHYPALAALRERFNREDATHESDVIGPIQAEFARLQAGPEVATQASTISRRIEEARVARLQAKTEALQVEIGRLQAVAAKFEAARAIEEADKQVYTNSEAVAAAYEQFAQAGRAFTELTRAQAEAKEAIARRVLQGKQGAYARSVQARTARIEEAEHLRDQYPFQVEQARKAYTRVIPRFVGQEASIFDGTGAYRPSSSWVDMQQAGLYDEVRVHVPGADPRLIADA